MTAAGSSSNASTPELIEALKKLRALERALERQRAISAELETLVEDRTRNLYLALEDVKRQARVLGQQAGMRALIECGSLEEAAPEMLRAFCENLRWDVGHLWSYDPRRKQLVFAAEWTVEELRDSSFRAASKSTVFAADEGLPGRSWASGFPIWIADVTVDDEFRRATEARACGIRAGCAFPVLMADSTPAVIELFAREARALDGDLMVTLAGLGEQIGQHLQHWQSRDELRRQEMNIARGIQTSILPRQLDARCLSIAATTIPAADMGGDYYDVLPYDGGCYIAVGDVAGHGLSAGIVMLMVQSAMSAAMRGSAGRSPSEILCIVNEVLFDNIRARWRSDEHITLTLLKIDDDGRVTHSGAHEDILVVRANGDVEAFDTCGTWLGAKRDIRAHTSDSVFHLHHDDVLVLYTDGVTEARDDAGRFFDLSGLKEAIAGIHGAAPASICERIVSDVTRWAKTQTDDVTIMAARYDGRPGPARRTREP